MELIEKYSKINRPSSRLCKNPECGKRFIPKRRNMVHCSQTCRKTKNNLLNRQSMAPYMNLAYHVKYQDETLRSLFLHYEKNNLFAIDSLETAGLVFHKDTINCFYKGDILIEARYVYYRVVLINANKKLYKIVRLNNQ